MGHQRAVLDYTKLSLILLFGAIFYNEFLAYFSAYTRWPTVKWPSESLRILFVADPQIQGVLFESPFPLGTITRWDSDRYLSKTFSWAMSAYNPQVVVFLGDLIDEGSSGYCFTCN
jgi:ethanolamine phosphate phosphodiesterase